MEPWGEDEALWSAWTARLRTKAVGLVLNLAVLAAFAVFLAVVSGFGCLFGGFVTGIAALAEARDPGSDGSLAVMSSLGLLVLPIGGGVLLLGVLGMVISDPVCAAVAPARVIVGRIERVEFVSGMRFGGGRMRWELVVVPERAWEVTRARAIAPTVTEGEITLRTLPGVAARIPEGERALLLVLADGTCCHAARYPPQREDLVTPAG
jgi:hypothetical protein